MRIGLIALGALLVVAGVVFAVVDLGAADQVASVASFVLAALVAGRALLTRPAAPPAEPPAGPASDPPTGGPGSRTAINSGVVFMGDGAFARVKIKNRGGRSVLRWWR